MTDNYGEMMDRRALSRPDLQSTEFPATPPADNSSGGDGASPCERQKAADAGTSLWELHLFPFVRKGYYGSFVPDGSFRG